MEKSMDLFLRHNNADEPRTERLAAGVEAGRSEPPLKVFPTSGTFYMVAISRSRRNKAW
jgi:hypothetical protein